MDRSRETLPFAGIALAMAGDVPQANAVADELGKRFPLDTVVQNIWLPLFVRRSSSVAAIRPKRLNCCSPPLRTNLVGMRD